jgi:hypothetical protein
VELQPVRITLRPVGSTYEQAVYEIGQLRLNTPEELYNQLATQRKAAPDDDVPVIIFPSNAVRWEFVTEAFNAAVRARFRKIGFQGETGPR